MTEPGFERVKSFWEGRASDISLSEQEVTHPDVWQRWVEVETIRKFLKPTDRVLDVGCGNGHTSRQIAQAVREVVGLDYSDEMVRRAVAATTRGEELSKRISYSVCDVRTLGPGNYGLFDVAISERCLINLGSWEEQKVALSNIASVLVDGGRLLLVEGSADGRAALNVLRQAIGLESMPPVWHNRDFIEKDLLNAVEPVFELHARVDLGVYDLISRVVHPTLVAPDSPRYDSQLNELAARLTLQCEGLGQISRLLFLVLVRKSRKA